MNVKMASAKTYCKNHKRSQLQFATCGPRTKPRICQIWIRSPF